MTLSEFYLATPRETVAVIRANAWRVDRDMRAGLRLAWHVAMLQRARVLPTLDAIMPPSFEAIEAARHGLDGLDYRGRPKPTPAQEWEKWTAIALAANAQHARAVENG